AADGSTASPHRALPGDENPSRRLLPPPYPGNGPGLRRTDSAHPQPHPAGRRGTPALGPGDLRGVGRHPGAAPRRARMANGVGGPAGEKRRRDRRQVETEYERRKTRDKTEASEDVREADVDNPVMILSDD